MKNVQRRTMGRLAAMVMVAGLGLAACGSDGTTASGSSEPGATTTVAAAAETTTTEAVTTTAAAPTTTAYVDPTLAVIAKLENCNTLNSLVSISTGERDGAKDAGKKLYQDRIDMAQKRITELKCEAAPTTTAAAATTTSAG